MMLSPNRVFATVLLAALAVLGFIGLFALSLLNLGVTPARSGIRFVLCLLVPESSVDTAVHGLTVLTVAAGGGVLLAGMRAAHQARVVMAELRRATRRARVPLLPSTVVDAARAAGVGERVDLVDAPQPFGFAYGWVRPRVCLSTGLVNGLSRQELEAVFHHERWHVTQRDPARLLVLRTVVAACWFAPPIRRLAEQYVLATEIAADHHAVTAMGHSRWLAGALAKTLGLPVVAPAFDGYADARIAALSGDVVPMAAWKLPALAAVLVLEIVILLPLPPLSRHALLLVTGIWALPLC